MVGPWDGIYLFWITSDDRLSWNDCQDYLESDATRFQNMLEEKVLFVYTHELTNIAVSPLNVCVIKKKFKRFVFM